MSLENVMNIGYYRNGKQMDKKINIYAAISNKHIRSFKTLSTSDLYEAFKYQTFPNRGEKNGIC